MYRLREISYSNFKYVKSQQKPFSVSMAQAGLTADLVMLDGANGYGKTTLYDAIELLLTGEISHFKKDLLNKGEDTYETLKNDSTEPIVIIGVLADDKNGDQFTVKLIWHTKDEYYYEIDGEVADINALMQKLKINKQYFDIGVYISQSESLSFLSQKFRERRTKIASLLGENNAEQVNVVKKLLEQFQALGKKTIEEYKETQKSADDTLEKIRLQIDALPHNVDGYRKDIEVRLFPEREDLIFDHPPKEGIEFSTYNETLNDLQMLIENYNAILTIEQNKQIDRILEQEEIQFRAIYNHEAINKLLEHRVEMLFMEKLQKLTDDAWKNDADTNFEQWSHDLLPGLGFSAEQIESIRKILEKKYGYWERLNSNQKLLERLNRARIELWSQHNSGVKGNIIPASTCPFCGRKSEDLQKLFNQTGEVLNTYRNEYIESYNQTTVLWLDAWTTQILPAIKKYQNSHIGMYLKYIDLKALLDVKTEQLEKLLSEVGEIGFAKGENDFKTAYDALRERLKDKRKPAECLLKAEEINRCMQLLKDVYHGEKPFHTERQIQNKRNWLVGWFRSNKTKQLQEAEKHKIIVENKFKTFKQKYQEKERFLNKVLLSRFNDAVKDYNSDVLTALRLPVFLYSGKILQNYPLGLGIRLEVNKTQLVFRGSDRDDKDVYNLLSTGQLNGLAISVLLAVHDVCRKKHELELLMIDDPLQTMDEISSISLADMLASSVTGQIILSTHENSNADLIWYKFKQMGRRVVDIDMQKKYLKFNKN